MFHIYILLSILTCYLGIRVSKTFANPLSAFSGIWLTIVLLYQLRLSGLQKSLNQELYFALTIVLISFTAVYLFIRWLGDRWLEDGFSIVLEKGAFTSEDRLGQIASICFALFVVWLVASVVEVLASGGVPVLWLLTGSSKTYFDFGIPSVHGFLNALGILIATVAAYLVFKGNRHKKRMLMILAVESLYYLLIISRQVIMSAALQALVVYVIVNRRSVPYFRLLFVSLFGVVAFGIIGNMRTGYHTFMQVAELSDSLPPIAAGFYWVYMYLTMTLANLNNLIVQIFEPLGIGYLFQDFIPSVISRTLEVPYVNGLQYLESIQFNVSGFFAHYFEAFGWIGLIVAGSAYGALGGFASSWFDHRPSPVSLLFFAITMQIILLSFFTDLLLYLPVSFQLILALLFGPRTCSVVGKICDKMFGTKSL